MPDPRRGGPRCRPRFRGLLRAVLDHIGDCYPEDLERIRHRVSRVELLRTGEKPSATSACYGDDIHGAPECFPGADGTAAWPIRVSRWLIEKPRETLVEVLVHELGHAACTPDDIEARSGLGREWGNELAADHHAARWGFGRLIRRARSGRSVAHHGPVPGEAVTVRFGEHRVDRLVTDDRVLTREGPVRRRRRRRDRPARQPLHVCGRGATKARRLGALCAPASGFEPERRRGMFAR